MEYNSHYNSHRTSNIPYMPEEKLVEDCEEAILEVGSNGKYQKICLILLTICYTCTESLIANSLVFFELDPKIKCFDANNTFFYCERKVACKRKHEFMFINQTYSWTNDFRLTCKDDYIISLFGILYYVGTSCSTLFASSISDYIGRSKVISLSMVIRVIFIIFPLIFPNLILILICLFFLGFLNPLHTLVPYILMSEICSKYEKDKYQTIMFILQSFSGIFTTLFFFLYQNWRIFLLLDLCYGIVFIIFSRYLLESPRFLYSKNRFDEARLVIQKIGKINKKKIITVKFETEIREIRLEDQSIYLEEIGPRTISFKTIWKVPFLRKNILILPVIWLVNSFILVALNFEIKYLKVDVYTANFILYGSEAISYILSNVMMKLFGKKYSLMIGFIICAISNIVFYFFDKYNHSLYKTIYVFICISKFGASVLVNVSYNYTNEVFPTNVRGRAFSICSFAGKFGAVFAPLMVELSNIVIIFSGSLAFCAIFITIPLDNRFTQATLFENNDLRSQKSGKTIEKLFTEESKEERDRSFRIVRNLTVSSLKEEEKDEISEEMIKKLGGSSKSFSPIDKLGNEYF